MNTSARKILIGLITNKEFVKRYINKFPKGLFLGEIGAGVVEKWCFKYFNKYGDVVGRNIQHAYNKAVENKTLGRDELEFIELLLTSLSNEYDNNSSSAEYLIDEAVEYAISGLV